MTTWMTVITSFAALDATTKRLEMRDIVMKLYQQLSPEECAMVTYLFDGRLAPKFIPIEFQIAGKSIEKVICERLHFSPEKYKELLASYGDVGSVWGANAENTVSPQKLTVDDVYDALWQIAGVSGKGSTEAKQSLIGELLMKMSPLEGKYTLRILNGKLRLGVSEKTILDAATRLFGKPEDAVMLENLYGDASDLGYVVQMYKEFPDEVGQKISFTPGVPVLAKLVEREESLEKIFERIPKPVIEPKYDGLRMQIHVFRKDEAAHSLDTRIWYKKQSLVAKVQEVVSVVTEGDWQVGLFSRELESMTSMFPEVVKAAVTLPAKYEKKTGQKVTVLILDGEVLGYDYENEQFSTYQDTMKRRRKHDVSEKASETPAKVFIFDALWVNDKNLMRLPLSARKEYTKFLTDASGADFVVRTPEHYPVTVAEAEEIFESYVLQGLEGVIFKNAESIYIPGERNLEWIKYKRDMKEGAADSLDLVIMGYYHGEGRLAALGIGKLLLGAYDPETAQFLTVTKVGTKVTYEQWAEIKKRCDEWKTKEMPPRYVVKDKRIPDIWVQPALVIEVQGYEITRSPDQTSGFSLRFPKFIRFREKSPEHATSVAEISSMCKA